MRLYRRGYHTGGGFYRYTGITGGLPGFCCLCWRPWVEAFPRNGLFLEEQFRRSGTSPVLYLEALHLANFSPTLMMKLDTYELQLLHFGARNGILSEDLVGHLVYLAGKEKYYKECLFGILKACYEKKDPQPLAAICSLLIKGNKKRPGILPVVPQGVEQELRVTRLYEYYMMSVDLNKEVEIPALYSCILLTRAIWIMNTAPTCMPICKSTGKSSRSCTWPTRAR